MGRNSRLFAHSISSPDSQFAHLEVEIAESLRPCSRIFPFCGDYRQRLVRSRLPPDLGTLAKSVLPLNRTTRFCLTSPRNEICILREAKPKDDGRDAAIAQRATEADLEQRRHVVGRQAAALAGAFE
jgi:hypothetical protein